MKNCTNCGLEVADNKHFCKNCGMFMETDDETKPKKRKKAFNFKSILITILAIIIGRFLGATIANEFLKTNSTNATLNKMESYVESIDSYTPGTYENGVFKSEYFNFKLEPDNNWVNYTREELEPTIEKARENGIAAGVQSMKENNAPQEIIDEYIDSFYTDTEIGMYYEYGDYALGEISANVISGYIEDLVGSDDYINGMVDKFRSFGAEDVYASHEYIAGRECDYISAIITTDGERIHTRMYIMFEAPMICCITIRVIDGYEDIIFESFKDMISYN